MRINIYQINSNRDVNNMLFVSYSNLEKFQDNPNVDSKIYDKIYEKDVNCNSLEQVYQMLNLDRPSDFNGHSLSVSDVVEVIENEQSTFYFCDSVGFKKVDFNPLQCSISDRINTTSPKLNVLVIEPLKQPKMVEIDDSLSAMQSLVGGYIEVIFNEDDNTCIVVNENGKIDGLPFNRALYHQKNDRKEIRDLLLGTVFICGCNNSDLISLNSEQIKKYTEMYKYPERISKVNGEYTAIQIKPRNQEKDR